MTAGAASRGQPLLVLAGLLGAWLALRVVFWQPSTDATILAVPSFGAAPIHARSGPRARLPVIDMPRRLPFASTRLSSMDPSRASWPKRSMVRRQSRFAAAAATGDPVVGPTTLGDTVRLAIGHTLLLAAGLSRLELPRTLAVYLHDDEPPAAGVPAAAPALAGLPQNAATSTGPRWSTDSWLMLRQDTITSVAPGGPSYGRSQAGAVVRYRLAALSAHAPQAYLRASSALAGPREADVAAGLSVRPLPHVPLRLALEARMSETGRGTELRPAALGVTELPPVGLPLGLRGEAYVQGGYVGGTFATPFIDGQARIERTVARLGDAEVTAGAGAWGGAQKGAARLDIGPSAAMAFRLGEARGRVAADYRIRIAGEAEPHSGPALTLSAGF